MYLEDFKAYLENKVGVAETTINNQVRNIKKISDECYQDGIITTELFGLCSYEDFVFNYARAIGSSSYEKLNKRDSIGGTNVSAGFSNLKAFYKDKYVVFDVDGDYIYNGFTKKGTAIETASTEFLNKSNHMPPAGSGSSTDGRMRLSKDVFDLIAGIAADTDFTIKMNREECIDYMYKVLPLFQGDIYADISEKMWRDVFEKVMILDENFFEMTCHWHADGDGDPYLYFPDDGVDHIFKYKKIMLFAKITQIPFTRYESSTGEVFLSMKFKVIEDDTFGRICSASLGKNSPYDVQEYDLKTHKDFFEGLIYSDADKKRISSQIEMAINAGKHILLVGSPGTGKSKLAQNIAKAYTGGNYKFYTAHAEWTTYDTIGGYTQNERGEMCVYEGKLLKSFRDMSHSHVNNWLVIDEINRTDINKTFGEFFSILSGDSVSGIGVNYSNGKEIQVKYRDDIDLPGGLGEYADDHQYIIPNTWRMIGTLNTADKSSLYDISVAFMRRFAMIYVGVPELTGNLMSKYINSWKQNYPELELLKNKDGYQAIMTSANIINKYVHNTIGPALIRDALVSAGQTVKNKNDIKNIPWNHIVAMYFIPQLDGCGNQISKIYAELSDSKKGIGDSDEAIKEFIREFLGYDIKD